MNHQRSPYRRVRPSLLISAAAFASAAYAAAGLSLSPLSESNKSVEWWFVFKFNAATYPGDESIEPNPGIFGGTPVKYQGGFSLSYAYASSSDDSLKMGLGCIGTSTNDPVGATFEEVYHGDCYYVLWNDQFYNDPLPTESSPWGHSKGMLAWDESGNGLVMQVSTPSWPASGSAKHPRTTDGNTLGCVHDDNVLVSQHFFSLKLNAADVAIVLQGLANASVVTDPNNPQIFHMGGPPNLQELAQKLGKRSTSKTVIKQVLSTGVTFISKPSSEHVPPWQLVSAELGGVPIRAATWWAKPVIDSTTMTSSIGCWDDALGQPNGVQIALSGTWEGRTIGFEGGEGKQFNHAKIGVSMDSQLPLCIFGDLNQQGTLNGGGGSNGCGSSQDGRGGTFYVLQDSALFQSLTDLLKGDSDPAQ